MRVLLLSILGLIILSCSNEIKKDNSFAFISTNENIPLLDIKINEHPDSTRKKMCEMYGFDLCEKCELVKFKVPLDIENRKGFIEVLVDFNTTCPKCPIVFRIINNYHIDINKYNKILVEGERVVELDSIHNDIEKYLHKNVYSNDTSKSFSYYIRWDKETSRKYLDLIFKQIYKAHLNDVRTKLKKRNINFDTLTDKSIKKLKKEFPLRIELDFGKMDRIEIEIRNY